MAHLSLYSGGLPESMTACASTSTMAAASDLTNIKTTTTSFSSTCDVCTQVGGSTTSAGTGTSIRDEKQSGENVSSTSVIPFAGPCAPHADGWAPPNPFIMAQLLFPNCFPSPIHFANSAFTITQDLAYDFDHEGIFRSIFTGEPFGFKTGAMNGTTMKRQEVLRAISAKLVRQRLLRMNMESSQIPIPGHPTLCMRVIHSSNFFTHTGPVLIVLQAGGVSNAGVWAPRLLVHPRHGLQSGSQIDLVRKAHENGFAVALLNANEQVPSESEMASVEQSPLHTGTISFPQSGTVNRIRPTIGSKRPYQHTSQFHATTLTQQTAFGVPAGVTSPTVASRQSSSTCISTVCDSAECTKTVNSTSVQPSSSSSASSSSVLCTLLVDDPVDKDENACSVSSASIQPPSMPIRSPIEPSTSSYPRMNSFPKCSSGSVLNRQSIDSKLLPSGSSLLNPMFETTESAPSASNPPISRSPSMDTVSLEASLMATFSKIRLCEPGRKVVTPSAPNPDSFSTPSTAFPPTEPPPDVSLEDRLQGLWRQLIPHCVSNEIVIWAHKQGGNALIHPFRPMPNVFQGFTNSVETMPLREYGMRSSVRCVQPTSKVNSMELYTRFSRLAMAAMSSAFSTGNLGSRTSRTATGLSSDAVKKFGHRISSTVRSAHSVHQVAGSSLSTTSRRHLCVGNAKASLASRSSIGRSRLCPTPGRRRRHLSDSAALTHTLESTVVPSIQQPTRLYMKSDLTTQPRNMSSSKVHGTTLTTPYASLCCADCRTKIGTSHPSHARKLVTRGERPWFDRRIHGPWCHRVNPRMVKRSFWLPSESDNDLTLSESDLVDAKRTLPRLSGSRLDCKLFSERGGTVPHDVGIWASHSSNTDQSLSITNARLARAWQRRAQRLFGELSSRVKAVVFTDCPAVLNLGVEGIGWGVRMIREEPDATCDSPRVFQPSVLRNSLPQDVINVRNWFSKHAVHLVAADSQLGTRLDTHSNRKDEVPVLSSGL